MKNLEYDMVIPLEKINLNARDINLSAGTQRQMEVERNTATRKKSRTFLQKTVQLLICMHSGQGILTRSLTKRTAENLRMVLQRNTT